jgi:hypothetical protein
VLKLIVNGLMRAMLKCKRVCKPGTSPVINEACMIVHEESGAFAQIRWHRRDNSLCPIKDKGFYFFKQNIN